MNEQNWEMKKGKGKRIVICSVHDKRSGEIGSLVIDRDVKLLHCELCNDFMCGHIKYAMSIEKVRKDLLDAINRICDRCSSYNLPGTNYCDQCGAKLEVG
ncbi:hypothetical protein [Cuniculiplasma divulgatum]|uniref:Zinc finger protein n=1 Tax=Cuniculiplasma divulgatum TaxID=1673428 RepID=A0A1N5TM13_9ARCH|nr:hypothetical protein [Cuniculiplasma divulgatum]SIM49364.1 zinc finger protein [Cuniculiplasma divulgatum]